MASPQARPRAESAPHLRLFSAGLVVLAYLVAGTLWVFKSHAVAEAVTELTSIQRWLVELGIGLWFVAVTALVLHVLIRRRTDVLEAAARRARHAGHRLKDSEDRNRLQATALSGTANAVVIADRDGTIEWVNEAFETITGYPSSVAVGATPQILHSGEHDEEFYRHLWETILSGQVWRGQVVNRRSDGELYTVSQTITPVLAENGDIQHFVAIHEDISERVHAAGLLEAGRLRLQALFDHALDAIVLADDQGRYIEVNPAVCEMTGYSHDELLGMGPADIASPDQLSAEVANQFDGFVHAGAEAGTFALRHKDGHVVETEFRAVSNIQPGVHLSVLRDVTARNHMLRAITVAESGFRELAENAADIVIKLRVNDDGRMQIDYVNPAAVTILGYPRERFYDDPDLLRELFEQRSDDFEEALDLLPSAAEPNGLATIQVKRADGRLVWLEATSAVTDPSTSPVTIQMVARDVTARSVMMQALEQTLQDQIDAAEQLRTLNAMKDTFLQSVSHELRTPLTSILGFAQLLADPRDGLSPTQTRDFHSRIYANAKRLQRLLGDIMDVDRLARGNLKLARLPTDLTRLVESVVDDTDLGDRVVQLDLEPIILDLDAAWVDRILANLLGNIVRHTPPDTRVWIQTRTTAGEVELIIDDDGSGIPAIDRQRVIEAFQQGADASSSAQPGTGLGLTLAHAVAKMHGGAVHIADSPAGGTRVTVTLAQAATADADAAEARPRDADDSAA